MEYRILGPLEVVGAEGPLPLGGSRQRAVLALLLIHAGQVVPLDRMIDELWAGSPPSSAHTTLRGYVSHLRRALEPDRARRGEAEILATSGPGYVLRVGGDVLDRDRFESLVEKGRRDMAAGCAADSATGLREALSLWRGPALADFEFEPFARSEITRLEELRLVASELRIEADLALGRHDDLVGELEGLVAGHPLREQLWAQLMTALYRCGRQAEALRAYQRVREVLADELGLDPGPALQQLEQAILVQDPTLDVAPVTPTTVAPASAGPTKGNLPLWVSPFVGRQQELAEVEGLVTSDRLVSLVGAGGTGKTRLAYEVAARLEASWPQGVWVAELAPLAFPGLVAGAVADALGVVRDQERSATAALIEALGRRRLLVVLDNCEHVLDGAARLARDLLTSCPGLQILVTSREPLGLAGERVWRVPSLATPARREGDGWWECDAVQLFAERAASVVGDFAVTHENAKSVVAICERLDGLPLAIELAAARLRVISVQEIEARLTDRFRLLTGGDRTAMARHRTLRAAVEWSYDALDSDEQAMFCVFAVFAGGFSLAAGEHVATGASGDALDVLSRLVDKSLVARLPDHAGDARYRILETLRAYGLERLTEKGDHEARSRHAGWCAGLADTAADHLRRPDQAEWFRRLDLEHDNLRAALGWVVDHADPLAVRMAGALWWFWVRRGHIEEGGRWLTRAAQIEVSSNIRHTVLGGMAYIAWLGGDLIRAAALSVDAESEALSAGDVHGAALAAAVAARVALDSGERAQALALAERAERRYEEIGDQWGVAWVRRHQAGIAFRGGDIADCVVLTRSARQLFKEMGDPWGVAGCLDLEAAAAHQRGDHDGARSSWEESISVYRALGDRTGLAISLHHFESFLTEVGEVERAVALAGEHLGLDAQLGRHVHVEAWTDMLEHMGGKSSPGP